MLKNYKELKVWQKAYQLCLSVYKTTKDFPKEEIYGLTSQIRRAAISVPSNIAEGYGRKTRRQYLQALYVAYGSNCELETQLFLSGDLGYIEGKDLEKLKSEVAEVERMLMGLINPVVALNSALGFIKPLTIEAQPLNQRNPLDYPNSDL